MKHARSARWSPAVVALVLVTGCGADPAGQDLCGQYADVQAAVEELRTAPPMSTDNAEDFQESVDELRLRADLLSDQLDQLQQISEGRLDTVISVMRQRVAEIRQSLSVATYEAAQSLTAQITAAQEDLQAALAPLNQRLETQCPDQ